ncbi:MAG: HlyD family efflux transporter periplasmic adaptor subunit [Eubacteriales bacterium]|jgi:putative membrane fusion protein
MKKSWIYIFCVVVAVYFGIQLYSITFPDVLTEPAEAYTAHRRLNMTGLLIRSEDVIYNMNGGVTALEVYDGSRVAKGAQVAKVYQSAEDVEVQIRIQELNSQINSLETAQSPTGMTLRDPVAIESRITELAGQIAYDADRGDMEDMAEIKEEIELLLHVKNLVTNKVVNFDSEIAALTKERDQLMASVSGSVENIYAPASGYFCSSIDGYEEVLRPDMLESVNVADVELMLEMEPAQPDVNADYIVGKLVKDFYWYYAGIVEEEAMEEVSIGQSVKMTFPFSEGQQISGTIYHISQPSDGKCALVIQSSTMTNEMKTLRKESCDMILGTYDGILVPKIARREVDGQVGVFTMEGSTCTFKPMEVLYEEGDYIIAAREDPVLSGKDCLQVGDEIIVKGDDLYDGKIIR